MINESNQEQNTPQQVPITKIRNKIKAKYNAEDRTRNTDLAMSKIRDVASTRRSKANGTTQIQIARREIEEKLTQMLELDKQQKKGKRAVLYLRVSSFPQAKFDMDSPIIVEGSIVRQELNEKALKDQVVKEQNLSKREKLDTEKREETQDGTKGSLRQQTKLCYKQAKEQGYYVTKIIVDIHTGHELYEREGMTEARKMFQEGEAEVMVSLCLDRVSRNMLDTITIVNEFKSYGIHLDCVLEAIDIYKLSGILMLVIQAFGNEDERERILRRTRAGKQDKIERGELIGHGRPGFGYRWVKDEQGRSIRREFDRTIHYDSDLTAYEVVRKIGEAFMQGAAMNAIARDLEAQSIRTPSGLLNWEESQVSRILKEPKYRGIATAGEYKTVRKGGIKQIIKNPDVYIYPDGNNLCPAYWTPEECELIDALFARNVRDNPRNNQSLQLYEFLLRYPFLRCGYCGYTMICDFIGQRPVYKCSGGRHSRFNPQGERCPGTTINADTLDQEIWEQVTPLLHNTGIMAELLTKLEKIEISEQSVINYDNIINNARKALDRLTLRRDTLDENDEDNEEVIASIERGIEEQSRIIREAKKKKAEVLPAAQEQERQRASIKKLLNWTSKASTALQESASLTEKRDALSALGIRVYVFPISSGCERWRIETNLENFNLQSSAILQLKNSAYAGKDVYPDRTPYLIAITPTRAFLNPELFAS